MQLSKKELKRYSHQIILPNITKGGQEKLCKASVTVIGLGALGSIISNNLARAGVGNIKLVDRDVVELDNLHRQILYTEDLIGEPKAVTAAEQLERINQDVKLIPIVKDVNFSTIDSIITTSEVILDGTDNLETRFLINDYSVKKRIPWIYGGVVGTQGMSMNIMPNQLIKNKMGPCFRCIVAEIPMPGSLPTCDTYGILNTVPIIIGSIQSTEAIKLILGSSDINRKLLYFDVWSHEFRELEIVKNESCKCCVQHDFEYLNVKKRTIITTLCGSEMVQITPVKAGNLPLLELEKKLAQVGRVKKSKLTLEFNIEGYKITLFSDGRALIKGTKNENVAKSLYMRYIGN